MSLLSWPLSGLLAIVFFQPKDLGVWFDEQLSFKEHMHDKINTAYSMLGIIKRNFKYLSDNTHFYIIIQEYG